MRLLNAYSLKFCLFEDEDRTPPYVIASHRWYGDDETTFEDFSKSWNTEKSGYKKVESFAQYVREHVPHVRWLWVDTCCIDKSNNAEVSEAVISMFRWYRKSEICLAYLYDVDPDTKDGLRPFRNSQWFKRGWTLQELLAPRVVNFVAQDWQVIGHKGANACTECGSTLATGPSLEHLVHEITSIPICVLQDYERSSGLSVEKKLEWAAGRETTRKVDKSYCMFGIFDVSIPVLYGERPDQAEKRLREAIEKEATSIKQKVAAPNKNFSISGTQIRSRNAQKFECLICQKAFKCKVDADQHRRDSHSSSPAFECPACPRCFNNKTDLEQHRKASHGSVFPFDCRFCKRRFQSASARNQHMQDSHR